MNGAVVVLGLTAAVLSVGIFQQRRRWTRGCWLNYHAQLPAPEAQAQESLFMGLPASFGDLCPKNRGAMLPWLNVRVGAEGLRFQIAGNAPFFFQGLPDLFIPWNQVRGLRVEAPSPLPEALRPMSWDRPAFYLDLALPMDDATGLPIPIWFSVAAAETEGLMQAIQGHLVPMKVD